MIYLNRQEIPEIKKEGCLLILGYSDGLEPESQIQRGPVYGYKTEIPQRQKECPKPSREKNHLPGKKWKISPGYGAMIGWGSMNSSSFMKNMKWIFIFRQMQRPGKRVTRDDDEVIFPIGMDNLESDNPFL